MSGNSANASQTYETRLDEGHKALQGEKKYGRGDKPVYLFKTNMGIHVIG